MFTLAHDWLNAVLRWHCAWTCYKISTQSNNAATMT